MSGELLFALLLIFTICVIVTGIIYINTGMKPIDGGPRKLGYIKAGWLIIGIYSILATMGIIYLCVKTQGFTLLMLIVLLPIFILFGLIMTMTFGIYNLMLGYSKKNPDKNKRISGWILLVINITTIIGLIVLIVLFMTGVIPIRLM